MSFINKEKLKDFVKSPMGAGLMLTVIVVIVVLTIISIKRMDNDTRGVHEVDPASGEEIVLGLPDSEGDGSDGIVYVGFSNGLLKHGINAEQFAALRNIIIKYATAQGIEITRMSFVKDSYNRKRFRVYEFEIMLNVDEILLKVELDASLNESTYIYNTIYTLYDDEGEQVYAVLIDETNACELANYCPLDEGSD